jgi:hypothetical protein
MSRISYFISTGAGASDVGTLLPDSLSNFIVSDAKGAVPTAVGSPATASSLATSALTTNTSTTVTALSWIATLQDSVIRADMTAAGAGGTVSETGMAKLFTDLTAELTTNKMTLSASQLSDLKTIASDLNVGESASSYVTYITDALILGNPADATWTGGNAKATALGDLAVGSTATHISELTGKWFLGGDLPSDIVSMTGYQTFTVSYSADSTPVYSAGHPSMSDVNQGYLGDCYLMSCLAEVAHQDPSLITSMITSNGNNTYGVRFVVNGVAEYVTVSNTLADGGTIFNSGSAIWASLIEKAYAQLQAGGIVTGNNVNDGNSWPTIGNGGLPEYALAEITGASKITDYSANKSSWNQYVYNNSLSLLGSSTGLGSSSVLSTIISDLAVQDDVILSSNTNAYASNGMQTLVADHALSIYGYDSTTGELEVRNPWGAESGQTWETTFEVYLTTLLAAGDTITIDNVGVANIVTKALASQAVSLQANTSVTSFTIADTAANVAAALLGLLSDTKLTGITLTDATKSTITLSDGAFNADSSVLSLISSPFNLAVTGVPDSTAAAMQSNTHATSFAIADTAANVVAALSGLLSDTKLTGITLTDATKPTITLSDTAFNADSSVVALISSPFNLTVTSAPVSAAAALQSNLHVTSFAIADTAANVTAAITALSADSKLALLTVSGTSGGDTLNLAGSKLAAAINLGNDAAAATAGLNSSNLSISGVPDAITLGSGHSVINYALIIQSGIETVANFQLGTDELLINMSGAPNSALQFSNITFNSQHAVAIYDSASPHDGVVLIGLPAGTTASSLELGHLTFSSGMAIII